MKKIFLIFVLFLTLQGFAQKTVYVFNFSSYLVKIGYMQTRPNTGVYPYYTTNYINAATANTIYVPSGSTYTLENPVATRFPFYSPTSSPVITSWRRSNSATSSSIILSTNLNNVLANSQKFHSIKFDVVGSYGTTLAVAGGGPNPFDNTQIHADYYPEVDGNGNPTGESIILILDY
jgi:hypothetical protein